jgi:hypothetical protein
LQSPGENLYEFTTQAGHTYTVTAYSCLIPIPYDLDKDCQVNFTDFVVLASEWIDNSGGEGVDLADLAQLALDWLECSRDPAGTCWQ